MIWKGNMKKLNITNIIMMICIGLFIISLIVFYISNQNNNTVKTFDKAHSINDLLNETGFYDNPEQFEIYKK